MEYKVNESLCNFPAWQGGKDTLEKLIEKGDCEEVEQLIDDMFCDKDTTDTDINDFLWFERDCIAQHLGYKDWEAYEDGWSESDLEDAEEWWDDLDTEEREELTGLKESDYEDYSEFDDAAQEWWDGHEDSEKVEIYYQND